MIKKNASDHNMHVLAKGEHSPSLPLTVIVVKMHHLFISSPSSIAG